MEVKMETTLELRRAICLKMILEGTLHRFIVNYPKEGRILRKWRQTV